MTTRPITRAVAVAVCLVGLPSGANASERLHVWTPVPHQKGIFVDLTSIRHGHFPTGPAMDGSPVADTRADVSVRGMIWDGEFYWCKGSMKFGPVQYGECDGHQSGPCHPTGTYDDNAVQAFVCSNSAAPTQLIVLSNGYVQLVGGQELSLAQLKPELQRTSQLRDCREIRLKPAKNTKYSDVQSVVELIQKYGCSYLGLGFSATTK
jgi:hypothetical protein